MCRREGPEPAFRLLELPLEPDPVASAGLVPRHDDMDETLEEVLLRGLGRTPRILERLVRGEVLALPREAQSAAQISRDRL